MTPSENKQLLIDVFAGVGAGNTGPMRDAMAEDFRRVFPGAWSWSGTWEPKEVVLNQLLGPLMDQFDTYRSTADRILAAHDRVIVQARADATTKRGDPYRQAYCYDFRARASRLTEVIEHCDTALVERVLTPPRR